MSPLVSKALRILGRVAYAGLVGVVFLATAYISFNLFVHSGAAPAPDVGGLSREEAAHLLSDYGLDIKVAEGAGRYDPQVPAGHVLAQHPGPLILVKRGSVVQVTLSLGPQRLAVPGLGGRSIQAAQVALAAEGLAVGRVLNVFSPGADTGTVVAQRPEPGTAVAAATPVELLVAAAGSAPAYLMPDLVYRNYEQVRGYFATRGFRFGSVKFEPYEGVGAGVILRQFPLAGHPVARADAISLVVATAAVDSPR
jgi:eukaryotic-like serine/threonine-protein kinase